MCHPYLARLISLVVATSMPNPIDALTSMDTPKQGTGCHSACPISFIRLVCIEIYAGPTAINEYLIIGRRANPWTANESCLTRSFVALEDRTNALTFVREVSREFPERMSWTILSLSPCECLILLPDRRRCLLVAILILFTVQVP